MLCYNVMYHMCSCKVCKYGVVVYLEVLAQSLASIPQQPHTYHHPSLHSTINIPYINTLCQVTSVDGR